MFSTRGLYHIITITSQSPVNGGYSSHSDPLLTRRQNLALNSSMSSMLLCSSHWFSNVNSASITKLELSKLGSLIICWYSSIIWSASRSFTCGQNEHTLSSLAQQTFFIIFDVNQLNHMNERDQKNDESTSKRFVPE